jgi:rod shape-determining protein MreD
MQRQRRMAAMAETLTTRNWLGRLTFAGLALALIFLDLLPLDTMPKTIPPPDLLLSATLVWVSRRPDLLPVWMIAPVFFLSDLLFQRPPGLWAALVLILTEVMRSRSRSMRSVAFPVEWLSVGMGIVAITIANRIALTIVMTPQAPLGLTLIQMLMTILTYPLVALAAQLVFGISQPAPGEVDARGRKL